MSVWVSVCGVDTRDTRCTCSFGQHMLYSVHGAACNVDNDIDNDGDAMQTDIWFRSKFFVSQFTFLFYLFLIIYFIWIVRMIFVSHLDRVCVCVCDVCTWWSYAISSGSLSFQLPTHKSLNWNIACAATMRFPRLRTQQNKRRSQATRPMANTRASAIVSATPMSNEIIKVVVLLHSYHVQHMFARASSRQISCQTNFFAQPFAPRIHLCVQSVCVRLHAGTVRRTT